MTIKDIRDIIDNVEITKEEDYINLFNAVMEIYDATHDKSYLRLYINCVIDGVNAYTLKTMLLDIVNDKTRAKGVNNNEIRRYDN